MSSTPSTIVRVTPPACGINQYSVHHFGSRTCNTEGDHQYGIFHMGATIGDCIRTSYKASRKKNAWPAVDFSSFKVNGTNRGNLVYRIFEDENCQKEFIALPVPNYQDYGKNTTCYGSDVQVTPMTENVTMLNQYSIANQTSLAWWHQQVKTEGFTITINAEQDDQNMNALCKKYTPASDRASGSGSTMTSLPFNFLDMSFLFFLFVFAA